MEIAFYFCLIILLTITKSGCTNSGNASDSSKADPDHQYQCLGPGWYVDPIDPSIYYVCFLNSNGDFTYYQYNCPKDTCFSAETRLCSIDYCGSSKPPDFECLKQNLADNAELQCKDETLLLLKKSLNSFIDASAIRGNPFNNYRLSVRDVHLQMRENYAKLIQQVGQNIYPLIVATDSDTPDLSGVGGAYKLYHRNGTMERIVPVPATFELNKCLSHVVLGIFATIAPYFRSPNSVNWRPDVLVLQRRIQDALYALTQVSTEDLPLEDQDHARQILTMSDGFLKECLELNNVDPERYQSFAGLLAPLIDKSMTAAAKAHASHTIPALLKWKKELGEDWKNVYVIIPTVWPVSKINIRFQMFEMVMSFEQIKRNVLIVEGARDENDARTTLGRVVADRALAQLVFGNSDEKSMKDHTFSLSTRRDLLSTEASKAIKDYCENQLPVEEERCPVAKLFATMLRTV